MIMMVIVIIIVINSAPLAQARRFLGPVLRCVVQRRAMLVGLVLAEEGLGFRV